MVLLLITGTNRLVRERATRPRTDRGILRLVAYIQARLITVNTNQPHTERDCMVAIATKQDEFITITELHKNEKGEITIIPKLPQSQTQKTIWGIETQKYHRVQLALLSPNYWRNNAIGNKHYMFMLENCINDGTARGFYNEFLKSELQPHRKTLEIVGSRVRTEETQNQLSGLGFSSTQRNELLCRVKGSFTRTIKIIF